MAGNELAFLSDWLIRQCGVTLAGQPAGFAEDRLQSVMHRFGFKNLQTLTGELPHAPPTMRQVVIESLTVNDSGFFRDPDVFAEFRDRILPDLIARRAKVKRLRIWSAACAAGQEPYSIAMMLEDLELAAAGWQLDITATDVHGGMIARASEGVFGETEVARGLSPRHLLDFFIREGGNWRIRDTLRHRITFRTLNLLHPFDGIETADVVFCRNVLMYFDPEIRNTVLTRIAEMLAPDGVLITGTAEPTAECKRLFRTKAHAPPGIYVKAAHARAALH